MKFLFGAILSLAFSIGAFAQSPGVDYYRLGEKKLAKEVLTKEISQNPAQAYYYLGQLAFQAGNMAEAKANYEKGLAANAESAINQIGIAKMDLKSNTKEAAKTLNNIAKKNKKDVVVLTEIAQAYLDNGMIKEALEKAEEVRKADKKSALGYIIEGDIYAKENKAGDAATQYEQAYTFDPSSTIAYVKYAKVYEGINSESSKSMLRKALEINPKFAIINKYLGDLNYSTGHYALAIDSYSKYFAAGDYSIDDLTRYAGAYFFTDNYTEAERLISEGMKKEPNNFVLNRLLMYTQASTKDYDNALATADKFFNRQLAGDEKYIPRDYETYGEILLESGDVQGALAQYAKLIELDETKQSIYKDVATRLANEDKNAEAAAVYAKYIETAGEAVESLDFYQLGRYYYLAAQNLIKEEDEDMVALRNSYIEAGDKAFTTVTERLPDNFLGYFWRARIHTLADPNTTEGLAKPYYEDTARVITESGEVEENAGILVEAYTYLAYYNYLQWVENTNAKKTTAANEAKANMKKYTEALLEVDPTNATGQQFMEVLK
ncbi:lipopolysaccharide assembly protein LapB [Dysgonomonas sp. 25]|uniref:tetratricopeptide repeat protein n=1 Tax=Dysgonomonas sp. 25 TaxID=2302933 RepID=UPI002103DA75|nr:tetratricopeptide repeat protein [Dysgonomonas sp. 25]